MTKANHFAIPITIYVADTDVTGIVYHANYLNYFERCRTAWLDELGQPLSSLLEQDTCFAIKTVNIEFIKPLKLGQTVHASAQVARSKPCSTWFHQTIHDPQDPQQIYCKADILVACLDKKLRPKRLLTCFRELAP